jgi:hypothetical protein
MLILLAAATLMNGCRSREQICADLLPTYQPVNWAVVQVNGNYGTRFSGTGNLPLIQK